MILLVRPSGACGAGALQIGDIDPSFDAGLQRVPGEAFSLVASSDGGVFIEGAFDQVNGQPRPHLVKCRPNGDIDSSFVPALGGPVFVFKMVAQINGQLVLLIQDGSIKVGSGERLIRLNADGTVDTSFVAPINLSIVNFVVAPSGRIYLIYDSYPHLSENGFLIGRLTIEGQLDPTFSFSGRVEGRAVDWDWKNLPTEKLVGLFSLQLPEPAKGFSPPTLLRFNEDGTLDSDFASTEIINAAGMTFLSDNRLLVRAYFGYQSQDHVLTNTVAVYLPDGTLDNNFAPETSTNFIVSWMCPVSSGQVVIGGVTISDSPKSYPPVLRLNADGSMDENFAANLDPSAAGNWGVALNDGSVMTTVPIDGGWSELAKLDPAGELDTSFDNELLTPPTVTHILPAPDGKWVVYGELRFADGSEGSLARLNHDGSLDSILFQPTRLGLIDLSVQSDGSVLFLGNGFGPPQFGRILANGGLDPDYQNAAFDFYGGPNWIQRRFGSRSDGKVVVAIGQGWIIDPSYLPDEVPLFFTPVVLLNSDGSPDLSLAPTNTFGYVDSDSLLLQPDDRILISGRFASPANEPMPSLLRLLPNGNLDESFLLPDGTDVARLLLAVQRDGRILLGKDMRYYDDDRAPDPAPDQALIRLYPDGSLDTTFSPPFGKDVLLESATVQNDQKLLVCGRLFDREGKDLGGIVRLEPDGSIDESFRTAAGIIASASGAAVQGDGRVLVAKDYENGHQIEHLGLVRFESIEQPQLKLQTDAIGNRTIVLTGNTNRVFEIEAASKLSSWQHFATETNVTWTIELPLDDSSDQSRFFRARVTDSQ